MDSQFFSYKEITLSRIAEISRINNCHEIPRHVSLSCDWADGNAMLFEPFEGVHFGVCDLLTVTKEKISCLQCNSSVLVCIVVASGEYNLNMGKNSDTNISITSNVFALGEFSNIEIATRLPQQNNFSHVAIIISKDFFENIFGKKAYIHFRELLSRLGADDENSVIATGLASAECMRCVKCFIENKNYFKDNTLYTKYSILEFFFKVMQSAEGKITSSNSNCIMDDDLCRIKQLKNEIENDFLTIDTVESLYPKIGMNKLKVNHAFKSLYGISVAKFVHQCKMAHAYSMLKTRKMNVSQCASFIGYTNVGHFINAYKKLYGITPKQTMRQT